MKKKILCLFSIFLLSISLLACSDEDIYWEDWEEGETSFVDNTNPEQKANDATTETQNNDTENNSSPSLSITRNVRSNSTAMGQKDTWTIFIYLCGSDLESEGGYATENLEELFNVEYSSNVKFIVQTGGAKQWYLDGINPQKLQRFEVKKGGMELINEVNKANMGASDTLSDFLSWGVTNYPAEKMGVIFWNHGGGSLDGVIFDELFNDDSLSLVEIDSALSKVSSSMTSNFEFIGFDACLMATIETANILANYSNYMIASEELESGGGWLYDDFASFLVEKPNSTGDELGKVICDGYYEKCKQYDDEAMATLSVVDLSKIDDILYAFDEVASIMADNINTPSVLAKLTRGANSSEKYGGNSDSEGYTNMIDLGDFVSNISSVVGEPADTLLSLLDKAVVYSINGSNCPNSTGLSLYYPLEVYQESLLTFKKICVSSYYLMFIDAISYGSQSGNLTDYDSNWSEDNYGGYWSSSDDSSDNFWEQIWNSYFNDEDYDDSYFSFYDEEDTTVYLEQEPIMTEDGYYQMIIDYNSLDYVQSVYFSLFMDLGNNEMAYLGMDNNLFFDLDTGVVEDNFAGCWCSLPDGQFLPMYIIEEADEYNLYTCPITLNGKETNLRIEWVWDDPFDIDNEYGEYIILGAWDGVSESGKPSKELTKIRPGDIIVPIYTIYDSYDDSEYDIEGEEYRVTNDFIIEEYILSEGDYYYSYEIVDIFNESIYTDFTTFYVDEEGEIFFYDENEESYGVIKDDDFLTDIAV